MFCHFSTILQYNSPWIPHIIPKNTRQLSHLPCPSDFIDIVHFQISSPIYMDQPRSANIIHTPETFPGSAINKDISSTSSPDKLFLGTQPFEIRTKCQIMVRWSGQNAKRNWYRQNAKWQQKSPGKMPKNHLAFCPTTVNPPNSFKKKAIIVNCPPPLSRILAENKGWLGPDTWFEKDRFKNQTKREWEKEFLS